MCVPNLLLLLRCTYSIASKTQTKAVGQPPPGKNVHYSRCQLYIGDFELPTQGDPKGLPELQPFVSFIYVSCL